MQRMPAQYLSLFTALAVALSVAGLYGFVAYVIQQRRFEFGIRVSMGATAKAIVRQYSRRYFLNVLIGLALGALLCALVAQSVQGIMPQADPYDATVYLLACSILLATCVAAVLIPVARLAIKPPMAVLRAD